MGFCKMKIYSYIVYSTAVLILVVSYGHSQDVNFSNKKQAATQTSSKKTLKNTKDKTVKSNVIVINGKMPEVAGLETAKLRIPQELNFATYQEGHSGLAEINSSLSTDRIPTMAKRNGTHTKLAPRQQEENVTD